MTITNSGNIESLYMEDFQTRMTLIDYYKLYKIDMYVCK